jgi:high-affinity nickel-transport protein
VHPGDSPGFVVAAGAVFSASRRPERDLEMPGAMLGTLTLASFLHLIVALNLIVLAGMIKVSKRIRRGELDEAELEKEL